MNQDKKTEQKNDNSALRTRAAVWAKDVISSTLTKENLKYTVKYIAFYHQNINPVVATAVYNWGMVQLDSGINAVFNREPDAQGLAANLTPDILQDPDLTETEPQEIRVA